MHTAQSGVLGLALLVVLQRIPASQAPHPPELIVQTGHAGVVTAVDISSSGRLAATGGYDGTAKLWDLRSRIQLRTLTGHSRELTAVALSPDGSVLATAALDDTIVAWNVDTGRRLWTVREADSHPQAVQFSHDGRTLISGGYGNRSITIWDAATGVRIRRYPHVAGIDAMTLSRDGRLVAAGMGAPQSTIIVQDIATGHVIRSLEGSRGMILAVAFSPDGRWIASGAGDGRLHIWDLAGGQRPRIITGLHDPQALDASPDGSQLAVCGVAGVRLLDTTRWESTASFKGDCDDVQFSPDGSLLMSTDAYSAPLWDVTSARPLGKLGGAVRPVRAVVASSDGRWIATPGESTIGIWDTIAGSVERVLSGHRSVRSLAFRRGGAWLASGGGVNDNSIRIWDVSTGKEALVRPTAAAWGVSSIDFSRDGQYFVTGGSGVAEVWSWLTASALGAAGSHLAGTIMATTGVAFHPGGTMVAVANLTAGLQLWDLETGRIRRPSYGQVAADSGPLVRFSPDGRTVALGGVGRELNVFDLQSEGRVWTVRDDDSVTAFAFSQDGRRMATGSWNGGIAIWSRDSEEPIGRLPGHTAYVNGLAFSEDDRWLLSAANDGTARLWDVGARALRATMIYFDASGQPEWLVVAPDGLFDGTANAMEYVGWRTGPDLSVAPLSALFNDFSYPSLLAEILEGGTPKAQVDIVTALRLPGLRTLIAEGHAEIRRENGRILVCLDEEPTHGTLRLYRRGAPTTTSAGDFSVHPDSRCVYRRELPDDGEQYELVAQQPVGAMGSPVSTPWDAVRSDVAASTLHVQTIGIDAYPVESGWGRLRWAAADARAVARFFSERAAAPGHPYRRTVVWDGLYDGSATREAIRSRLRDIAAAMDGDDVAFIFLSGHGTVPLGEQMFYFLPSDVTGTGPADQRRTGLNTAMLAEAIREMPARRIVLVIDACQSGGAVESVRKVAEMKARIEMRRKRLRPDAARVSADAVGVHVIMAATPLQDALERPREGRGLLTIALLDALAGTARPQRAGPVYIRTVVEEVRARLPALARQSDERQTPLIVSVGADFPIARP